MKRSLMMLLVSLAVCLAIVSCVLPWWSLTGSTVDVTTSSTLYLAPPVLVTMTRAPSVLTGELAFIPDMFTTILMMILVMIALGCLLCGTSLVFQRMKKPRLHFYSTFVAILLFGGCLVMFLVAMTLYSEVSVGSILGQGNIEVSVPGVSEQFSVPSHWGPDVGVVVFILSLVLLLTALLLVIQKNKKTKET
jgi:Na+-driven multidrug efflux pump